ncbi:MAG: fasciclin domain-containing protein [Bacteroidaceae bacterium]|nr:fasciclin domain-containing protein [Bacteroidaceae bacterium]
MKYNMKYTKVLGLALAALAFNACSDEWDEHYKVQQQGNGVSLWQTISTDANFSNFKSVLEYCGYDKVLASSQVFTVFAPTNESLSAEQAKAQRDIYDQDKERGRKEKENRAIKEFVMNHIALYNHSTPETAVYNDTIVMMNGKYLALTNNTIGEQSFDSQQPHANGILYTVDGQLDYLPNVLEQLEKVDELSKLAEFFDFYNEYKFIPEQSVAGGIENGQTVYLDSVTRLQNILFDYVGDINNEDSTYWMIVPTDDMWNAMEEEYVTYFNYDDKVSKRDSLIKLYTGLAIIRGTVFSETVNPEKTRNDSVKSTNAMHYSSRYVLYGNYDTYYYQYDKPFEPGGVFYDVNEIPCSNGKLLKPNTWSIDKSQTFNQMILTEGEDRPSLAYIDGSKAVLKDPKTRTTTVAVRPGNPYYNKVSGNSFIEISAIKSGANTSATFYVPDVLSNMPYDIYVVMTSVLAADTSATDKQRKPLQASFKLKWLAQDGVTVDSLDLGKKLEIQSDVHDTILLKSNVVIPTCTWGLTNEDSQVTLTMGSDVKSTDFMRGKYTKTIRLDAIIFKPHGDAEEIVID